MKHLRRNSLTLVLVLVSMWLIIFFWPLPPLSQNVSYGRAVYAEHHQLLRLSLSQDGKYRLYTPLSSISPELISATLLQEDQYFRYHPGVNPISLMKAVFHTLKGPRRMGASTITMQLARIRYGIYSKSFTGKIRQIFRAIQLELHYTKDEILEAYLNLAPYGNNIEGVGAASIIYFGKPVKNIALTESLTLTVIPQHPAKRILDHELLKNIRNKLYSRWVIHYPQDKNKKPLFDLPLQIRSLRAVPFLAPHFVDQVLADSTLHQQKVISTLDLHLQQLIERVTRKYISRHANLGVMNASVMLVDTRDMSVKAMLGSANFFDQKIGGQINATAIKRSPGSTLKPFIYALALDQGLIHPATILKDVPRSFGNYNPENFDNDFMGPISAKEALTLSRNIPAIYLADQLKNPSLYEFLRDANISNLKSPDYYGLALVLGGAELSMQELITLYAALSNDGVWQPLRFTREQYSYTKNKKILSREASFLVLDMLKKGEAAHKTGTSSGFRDAWTIGMYGPYILSIWIGNVDNTGNPAFVGKQIAAPLFWEITSALKSEKDFVIRTSPDSMNLVKVDVCKASGMLPTRYCPLTEKVWFIPGKSPIKTDTIYREIAINKKTGLRACQFDKDTQFKIYEFWSSDLLKIFKRAGIERRIPPAYDVDCNLGSKMNAGFSPQIISPQAQLNYIARLSSPDKTIVPLTAVVDADVKNIFWFLNESFLGKTTRDKSFMWQALPGKYVIRAVDDYGRSDVREVKVEGVS